MIGASSGLGYAAAQQLKGHGFEVIATVRQRGEASRTLEEAGCKVVLCDVASTASMEALVPQLPSSLRAAVFSFGVLKAGPVEHILDIDIELALQTIIFGFLRACRAIVPLLREGAKEVMPYSSAIS